MIKYRKLLQRTKSATVLLVEDYEPLRNDMMEILEDLFKTVTVVSNGAEALKSYREYKRENGRAFDIVITDIEMPLMNGIDLCEILRQEEDEEQQIIVLSAHTDSEYLLRLINLGIAQFINKPIQYEGLLDALFFVCEKIGKEEVSSAQSGKIDLGEDVSWERKRNVLIQEGSTVTLTRHEILLMQLMIEKAEQICTGDDIMQHFYLQGIDLSEKSIRNLVFKLRKKLPKSAIESVYGMGYKLKPMK